MVGGNTTQTITTTTTTRTHYHCINPRIVFSTLNRQVVNKMFKNRHRRNRSLCRSRPPTGRWGHELSDTMVLRAFRWDRNKTKRAAARHAKNNSIIFGVWLVYENKRTQCSTLISYKLDWKIQAASWIVWENIVVVIKKKTYLLRGKMCTSIAEELFRIDNELTPTQKVVLRCDHKKWRWQKSHWHSGKCVQICTKSN